MAELKGAALAARNAKLAREGKNPEGPAKKAPRQLRPYPFHDGAVDELAALRMVKMVVPYCPADPRPEIIGRDGTARPNPRYTGEQNCQEAYKKNNGGVWDIEKCESLGHDPWHTAFRKTVVEDVIDDNPTLEDGTPNPNYGYVTEQRTRVKTEKRLNVMQIPDNIRHANKMAIALAIARGARPLEDFGIESPCEFRNCTKPVKEETRYGRFCSLRHAQLVGADARRIMLPVGGDPITEDQAFQEREETLENINVKRLA